MNEEDASERGFRDGFYVVVGALAVLFILGAYRLAEWITEPLPTINGIVISVGDSSYREGELAVCKLPDGRLRRIHDHESRLQVGVLVELISVWHERAESGLHVIEVHQEKSSATIQTAHDKE